MDGSVLLGPHKVTTAWLHGLREKNRKSSVCKNSGPRETERSRWNGHLSFEVDGVSLLLGFLLLGLIGGQAVKEVLTAGRGLHMLHAHVDALGNDAATHPLVHNYAQSMLGHVVHAACPAVV